MWRPPQTRAISSPHSTKINNMTSPNRSTVTKHRAVAAQVMTWDASVPTEKSYTVSSLVCVSTVVVNKPRAAWHPALPIVQPVGTTKDFMTIVDMDTPVTLGYLETQQESIG